MRVVIVMVLGLFGSVLGCGEEEREGALNQVEGDTGLVFVDGDIVAPDVADTADTTDTADTVDTADTTDTTDTTDTSDTADTDTTDTNPVDCDTDFDCPNTACEIGRCEGGTCEWSPKDDGTICDDGEVCTTLDKCLDGRCVGATVGCDDGNACTDDACKPGLGCSFTPRTCDDQNACTTDECKPAIGCVSTPVVCGPITSACQVARCDVQVGCLIEPAGQDVVCSDNDPCTTSDRCDGTNCVGDAVSCDDDNPCTNDVCVAGGCLSTPIAGCAASPACQGKLAGEACDDGDAGTSGDMCLLGVCRGYALTRIAGTTVANQQGLVILEVAYGPDGWSAIYWVADTAFRNRFQLAKIDDPNSPVQYTNTIQDRLLIGLRDGFVGDTNGRIWRFSAGAWTRANAWDTALNASGRGAIYDLWTARDRSSHGQDGTRRLWLIGEQEESGWVRYCVEQNGGVVCSAQDLDDFEDASIPQALAGVRKCAADGACSSSSLVLGADAWDGGDFFNDTFVNETGVADLWDQGRIPDDSAEVTTQGAVAWGPSTAMKALVVGTNGYIVARRADGSWSGPLDLKEGQSSRTFYSAWQGSGVVAIAATRRISSSQIAYELWTIPVEKDVEDGTKWSVHELARGPNVNAAGLYDVHVRDSGEVRAVGAIRRTSGVLDWLDGAVWVRTP